MPCSRRFFHSLLLFLLTLTRIRAGRLHAQLSTRERLRLRDNLTAAGWVGAAGVSAARATSQEVRSSMARRSAFPAAALRVWSILPCLLVLRAEVGQPREESLYLWIDAHQARVLIGFEEDILIVSEGKMAPFTHDFRRAQQRMPAIPVNIHSMNFTWQAEGQFPLHRYFMDN
ncbi:hypothetical protein J1605_008647 [Eschrichtius robustus]|uniref:WIF domain-containing protein n=1 Tax=Eschrichtius robustus TaxID=9764 RepID=A0AB34GYV9_ESCRO|nr:hypothetical protein J1605_008647 [Eschrichtius robustus]